MNNPVNFKPEGEKYLNTLFSNDYVNTVIFSRIQIPEELIEYYCKDFDASTWKKISLRQKLSLDFIKNHMDDINWFNLAENINLNHIENLEDLFTKEFDEKYMKNSSARSRFYNKLVYWQNVSEDFIMKHYTPTTSTRECNPEWVRFINKPLSKEFILNNPLPIRRFIHVFISKQKMDIDCIEKLILKYFDYVNKNFKNVQDIRKRDDEYILGSLIRQSLKFNTITKEEVKNIIDKYDIGLINKLLNEQNNYFRYFSFLSERNYYVELSAEVNKENWFDKLWENAENNLFGGNKNAN